jgi:hypothetical protein
MARHRLLLRSGGALFAGIATFLLAPAPWSERMFLAGLVLVVVFALLADIKSRDCGPVQPALAVLLRLLLGFGWGRARQSVESEAFLEWLLMFAAYSIGVGLCFAWRAYA